MFYSKIYELLPLSLNYKNNKLLNFDTNGNIYRKRICFANTNINELEYMNNEEFKKYKYMSDQGSYQVIIRIMNNNHLRYTVTSIQISH